MPDNYDPFKQDANADTEKRLRFLEDQIAQLNPRTLNQSSTKTSESSSKITTPSNLTAGESIGNGDGIRITSTSSFLVVNYTTAPNSYYNMYYDSGSQKYAAQSFSLSNVDTETGAGVAGFSMKLMASGTPVSSPVNFEIRTNNAGVPSNTVVTGSNGTVTVAGVNGSYTEYFVTYSPAINISANTTYWIVVYTDSSHSTGFFVAGNNSPGGYADGNSASYDGANWTAHAGDDLYLTLNYLENSDKVFKSKAITTGFVNLTIGVADGTYLAGDTISATSVGYKKDFTGLVAGNYYYISDTSGQLSTSAGTYAKTIGKAISTTTMFVQI
jgi:hypothetical protein